ncbi:MULTISPECIES: hypothetical protein [unclassified Streptomyces]|uniref:hypothetical protein n=1 Tax=unclassified Streptomyces TaxID=2593676 RepID=UPI0033D6B555
MPVTPVRSRREDAQQRHDQDDDAQDERHRSRGGVVPQDEGERAAGDDDARGPAPVGGQPAAGAAGTQPQAGQGPAGGAGGERGPRAHGAGAAPGAVQIARHHGDHRDDQDGARALAQEPHERVVDDGGGVRGQRGGRHGVQIDAAQDGQADEQHQHHHRHADAHAHQRHPVRGGRPHGEGGEHDRRHRQPDAQDVQQPHGALRLVELLGLQQRDRPLDGGDVGGLLVARGDQPVFDVVDERAEVQDDGVPPGLDGAAPLAGEHLHHGGVRPAVGGGPHLGELPAAHHLGHHVVHGRGQGGPQRLGQQLGAVGHPGRGADPVQGLGERGGDARHIDVGDHALGEPVGHRVLYGGVGGQRSHGLDVPVGVGHLLVRPGGDHGERGEQHGQHQQHRRAGVPESAVAYGVCLAQSLVLPALGGAQRRLGGGAAG